MLIQPRRSSKLSSVRCLFPQFVMLIQLSLSLYCRTPGVYSLNLSCLSNHGGLTGSVAFGVYSLNLSCLSNWRREPISPHEGVYSLNLSCLSNKRDAHELVAYGVYSLNLSCLSNASSRLPVCLVVFIPSICHAYPTIGICFCSVASGVYSLNLSCLSNTHMYRKV